MEIERTDTNSLRRPAEWEPHAATILAWPHNTETWPDVMLSRAEQVFVKFLNVVAKDEVVWLLTADNRSRIKAGKFKKESGNSGNLRIIPVSINDMWVRDTGPICVFSGDQPRFLNFCFNAWGGKYEPWEDDNRLPKVLGEITRYPVQDVPLTLEGGAIECNGSGTLVTTESVLLNPNRGNGDKTAVEKILGERLGSQQIIWLAGGLEGDDTDGHIDDLVRFVGRDKVVAVRSAGKSDINHEILEENYRRLSQARTAEGSPLEIIDLPQPETHTDRPTVDGSTVVPASYANFYITNRSVILPLYDERFDQQMIELFRSLFPNREVIGIEARDLVWGQGSFHCITQEVYES